MILVPNSWGSPLKEFNPCHDSGDGRFCSTGGHPRHGDEFGDRSGHPRHGGGKPSYMPSVTKDGVIQARTVEEAVEHILAGRDVELASTRHVNTVITKLAEMANEAKRLGQAAPTYDLCKVSVAGTNMFCTSKFRNAQYPEGVPRIEMPQMSGKPVPGSPADRLPKNDKGEVDGSAAFIAHLQSKGIGVSSRSESAARLKATQAELVGPKVAGMMTSSSYDPAGEPIFVSRDDYVIDGHHRWAAIVGRDAADGRLGGAKMKTHRVDAPISRILRMANAWATSFGIAAKAAGKGAKVG